MAVSKEFLLRQASNTIIDLAEQVEHMRDVLNHSITPKIAGIDLSSDQTLTDALDIEYTTTKQKILDLIAQLP